MEHTLPTRIPKPYDIRERLLLFACDVVRVAQELHVADQSQAHFRYNWSKPR